MRIFTERCDSGRIANRYASRGAAAASIATHGDRRGIGIRATGQRHRAGPAAITTAATDGLGEDAMGTVAAGIDDRRIGNIHSRCGTTGTAITTHGKTNRR